GDLVEKIPAGADWILADALGVEPIDDDVWHLVQDPLRESIGQPELLAAGDAAAVSGLAEGLLMSGLAMQATSPPGRLPAPGTSSPICGRWKGWASRRSRRSRTGSKWAWARSPCARCT